MAFNFNWSPLIADTSLARDMLTTALNKSPKPPIIVDDIIVTELNLGSVPPELEILEIGDLAEDRFRGIFKMSYTGDAYLTLKTRVQANPLNTYLSAKPSFASPQPLAASSGLTIPLQLTLSDIRLSGFVILVFSRQKGLTQVFRNDPLESLKVSSTFDSIPFVRDYLQKEIEGQLRVLFMDDLPAILHRLSLQLFSPEYATKGEEAILESGGAKSDEQPVDPLSSPPLDACDAFGRRLDDAELSSLSLDSSAETHATFSQKNLLRLATLNDSHRTLALFTPTIRDAVFRVWAGAAERGDMSGSSTPLAPSMSSRHHASASSVTSSVYSFSDSGTASNSRPTSLSSLHSSYGSTMSISGRSRARGARQRKHRIIDLRSISTPTSDSTMSEPIIPLTPTRSSTTLSREKLGRNSEEREDEIITPPLSPKHRKIHVRINDEPTYHSPRPLPMTPKRFPIMDIEQEHEHESSSSTEPSSSRQVPVTVRPMPQRQFSYSQMQLPQFQLRFAEKQGHHSEGFAPLRFSSPRPSTSAANSSNSSGSILEQAWMMKMAAEIATKVKSEKEAAAAAAATAGAFWGSGRHGESLEDETPPPAYAA